jgi:hypothetical protein
MRFVDPLPISDGPIFEVERYLVAVTMLEQQLSGGHSVFS